jgi:glutathione S-transferase
MKIFGNPGSTCTRKVLMTARETGTPFELEVIDFGKREHKQPAHLARQPFGQVPVIDDDGFVLYEARAIARYIDAKAGGPLSPRDLRERALMEQWISVETENFAPHAMKFIYHSVFKREQTPEILKTAGAGLDLALEVLDKALAGRAYLAGNQLSIADICFLPYLEFLALTAAASKVGAHPRVEAWATGLRQRPTWQTTIAPAK